MLKRHSTSFFIFTQLCAWTMLGGIAMGQGGTPQIPTGATQVGGSATDGSTGGSQTGGSQSGGQQTSSTSGGDGLADATQQNVSIVTSEDFRNQGFVGATADGIQALGYVGASSENSGPPLAEGATFGGGVNSSVGGGVQTGGAGRGTTGFGGQAGLGGQQGFGATGTGTLNGFSVTRKNVRAQLVPSFSAPQYSDAYVASQFNQNFYQQPASQNFAGQYSVTVENRTATVTGSAQTQADADRLIRQLRLQPGIYKIDNQLRVGY